ncbi:SRPBCC domain-containing protein [Arthrobacter crystallopoietes]|uniref:SRPBCC domain-containing protein n=1 Tax=Crystallibacter crystallopoietes TaxID=37928 RepID=UPI001486FA28|nr:SRPBCC domain-containing protein [Arthrobacter crystallopoietes]QTG79863.1 SRPBCC domain-containing protein [Arthrobacter crystallopoietes]
MTTLSPQDEKVVPSGRIERIASDYVLAFDRQLDYPHSYLWSLLAEPEHVAKWLGNLLTGWELGQPYELEVGGTVTGTVLQLNAPLSLQITWEDELDNESVLEWRMLNSNGGTLVQLRARSESRAFLTEGAAGWETILDAFEDVAAGRTPQSQPDRWAKLREAYSREYSLSHTMGTLGKDSGHDCVHFDRLLGADRSTIWQALTQPDMFGKWLAPGTLQLQVGGNVRLDFEKFTMRGDVTYLVNEQGLEYSWCSPEVEQSSVHWLLENSDGKTLLKLHHGLRSKARVAELMALWHERLDALDLYLSGAEVHPSAHHREALTHFYRRMAGSTGS